MKSEIELIKEIEAYLFHEMDAQQSSAFENERRQNSSFDQKVSEHFNFLQSLKSYGDKRELKAAMDNIHNDINLEALRNEFEEKPSNIISFWRKSKRSLAVAASIAILVTLSTLFFTGQFDKQNHVSNYSELKRDMETIKRSQKALIRNINDAANQPKDISQYGGTGFALSANGYIVTNYHVVKNADSLYVQNAKGESFKAETIYIDPTYDIAILKIIDPLFKKLSPLPYTFKKSNAELGEDVYTIGYPKDDIVYGKGYLSSSTGFGGDSTAYQVSIPVNPGNSGGPLMDSRGNVIGIVSGKQTLADGAAFAVKSDFVLKSIDNIPQDSLKQKININKKNTLTGLNRTAQIRKMQDFIFIVKVYN